MAVFIYALVVLASLKLLINTSRYIQCRRYIKMYSRYLADPDWRLTEHKSQIANLLEGAGVQDTVIGFTEPAGWGFVRHGEASVLMNLTNRRADVVSAFSKMLYEAKGTYRARALETFNPIYWIEFVIFLPRKLLGYLGIAPEHLVVKVTQLIYGVAVFIGAFLFALYRPDVEQLVKNWIDSIVR